ncbi:Cytoplasmic dynein 2 heavy chain 1 [Trichinella nelsoni]|uniref:Cytoplasmic dynein 2 heavy chain 1 n=1 Tax=Trichinella nelsoni TaxID=6336 RepID=A0A0V0RX21_9BILA|nr:Cytoplasmic dynein 2 heavy chain 1 [Trichinella nelsoni]
MKNTDLCVKLILKIAAENFDVPLEIKTLEQRHVNSLEKFLNESDCASVVLAWSRSKCKFYCSNALSELPKDSSCLVMIFFKDNPCVISEYNLRDHVSTVSFHQSIPDALYNTLDKVYSPVISNSECTNDNKVSLKRLINELQFGLQMTFNSLTYPKSEQLHKSDDDDSRIRQSISLSEESNFWQRASSSGNDERAEFFHVTLQTIAEEFSKIESLQFAEMSSLLDKIQNCFNEIWMQQTYEPFPQQRMKNLFEIISNDIYFYVKCKLGAVDFWNDSFNDVFSNLRLAISLCEQWKESCDLLTNQIWSRWVSQKWNGKPFTSELLNLLIKRLKQIFALRSAKEILCTMLDRHQCAEIQLLWKLPEHFHIFDLNANNDKIWHKLKFEIERNFGALARDVLSKINLLSSKSKSRSIMTYSIKVFKILNNFVRYKDLLCLPAVKQQFATERETLLLNLSEELKNSREAFRRRSGSWIHLAFNEMSETVSLLVRAKQEESQVEQTMKMVSDLTDDLAGHKEYVESCSDYINELQSYRVELFDSWCNEWIQAIDDPREFVSMQTNSQIMELSEKNGSLKVNYSDKLVRLIKETRQLLGLKYSVPHRIVNCVKTAQKYYKYAETLKQVSHFYNNAERNMLPCLQAMMLDAAVAFEKVIKVPKAGEPKYSDSVFTVSWNDPKEVENYIMRLQEAAERITVLNRQLQYYHQQICQKVLMLMDINLLHHQKKWKDSLAEIREIFRDAARLNISANNMKPWIIHWDWQLYKVLDYQYRLGLIKFSDTLSKMKVEILFSQKKLKLKPPIEEIRSKNTTKWAVIGSADIETLIEEHFVEASDWERSFRSVKQNGREAEKIPSEIEIACITINTDSIKLFIENLLQRIYDMLLHTLRDSWQKDCSQLGHFLNEAIRTLTSRPQSMEEITMAHVLNQNYMKKRTEIENLVSKIESKNKMFKTVAGTNLVGSDELRQQLGKFDSMLGSHRIIINDQMETLKSNVLSQIQAFSQHVERFAVKWYHMKPKNDISDISDEKIHEIVDFVSQKQRELNEIVEESKRLKNDAESFGLDKPRFKNLEELIHSVQACEAAWLPYQTFYNALAEFGNEEWIFFKSKIHVFSQFLVTWSEKLKEGEMNSISMRIQNDISKYRELIPVLKYCTGESFSEDHWIELMRLMKLPTLMKHEHLTFGHFLSSTSVLVQNVSRLKELNSRAQGEVAIRDTLHQLDLWGAACTFHFTSQKEQNSQQIALVTNWKEILNEIEEKQALVQSLKESSLQNAFYDRTNFWEQRLSELLDLVRLLQEIQRKWLSLSPVFNLGALPKEWSRFQRLDKEFQQIMNGLAQDNRIMMLRVNASSRSSLTNLVEQLQRCQKELNQYLEEKRDEFPRFYFIGDDDLLELLGRADDPEIIQMHLKKLFPGIHTVHFDKGNNCITAVASADGEILPLQSPVKIAGEVQLWLSALHLSIQETLKRSVILAVNTMKSGQNLDPSQFCSQVLCLSEQIRFCEQCEKAIQSGTLDRLAASLQSQLKIYTLVTTDSTILQLKLKALILDLIHNLQIVNNLRKASVTSKDCWQWQMQLRFYLENNETVIVRIVDVEYMYNYEYVGNLAKLVHTQLTDRCFLTFTQAMHMGLGGNPYGPTGTGKTETVKTLGLLLGRLVLVFNCDEGIDLKSMGRIFVGLIKCGAWGCFDEFNRLEEGVLSAVSMQIETIQNALKSKQNMCMLMDKEVEINPNIAVFVTLNPAGKEYSGRRRLPDNLKQLFRPVAMSQADNKIIAQTMLMSEGFNKALEIGQTLTCVFDLCREILSQQHHYDWGLRALKTVLNTCGNLLRQNLTTLKSETSTEELEMITTVHALRINTQSKLTYSDSIIFEDIIRDAFPGVKPKEIQRDELKDSVEHAASKMDVTLSRNQKEKVFDLYEQLQQRMGVIIVGPSGSGKTTIWTVLKEALIKMGKQINTYTFNPKAMLKHRLLGYIDPDTREWCDGLLTHLCRKCVSENVWSWIVCDGEIDPEWIESMNSVFDDNKLLTMASGERIQLTKNVNFIFECDNLTNASPATISRMGIVYLSQESVDIKAIVKHFIEKQQTDVRENLSEWFNMYFYRALEWILQQDEFVAELSLVGTVKNILAIMDNVKRKKEFLVRLLYGVSRNLRHDAQTEFATKLFNWAGEKLPDPKQPMNVVYEKSYDRLVSFDDYSDQVEVCSGTAMLVKTADALAALSYIDMLWAKPSCKSFIMFGPDECGKQLLLNESLQANCSTHLVSLHCTAETNLENFLDKLKQCCTLSTGTKGREFRPKDCERLVFTLGGFYDETFEWITISNVQIVFCINVSTNSKYSDLPQRFMSIMPVMSIRQAQLNVVENECVHTEQILLTDHQAKKNYPQFVLLLPVNLKVIENDRKSLLAQIATCMIAIYEQFFHLWLHEGFRIFRDRLTTENEKNQFDHLLRESVVKHWPKLLAISGQENILDFQLYSSCGTETDVLKLRSQNLLGTKLIKVEEEQFCTLLKSATARYNCEFSRLNLVITKELMLLVTQIERAITSISRSSLLMIAPAGVGRRSALALTAYLHNIELIHLHITPHYGWKQYMNDLKQALQTAALKNGTVILLIEDYQLIEDRFLDPVCSILLSGEVPGIFKSEELEPLLAQLRQQAAQDSYHGNMHSYFSERVKQNLRIVLIIDSNELKLATYRKHYGVLFKKCTVLSIHSWSKDSLLKISASTFAMITSESSSVDIPNPFENNEIFCDRFVEVFERFSNPSPKKLIAFVGQFNKLLLNKRSLIQARSGVAKLSEARKVVAEMKVKASEQNALLKEKQSEADDMLHAITLSMAEATEHKTNMEMMKKASEKESEQVEEQRKIIDAQLSKIEPLIKQAQEDVGMIRSESLSEIRSLRAPPETIRDILEAVLLFMGIFDCSWASMRNFLSKSGVKEEIINFDARKVSPQTVERVKELVARKSASFDPKTAKRASIAAAPLASWVTANLKYAEILAKIKPLEQQKYKLQKNLTRVERQMEKICVGLKTSDQRVAQLRERFETLTKEATQIKFDLDNASECLDRAEQLISKLGSEYERWKLQMQEMESDLDKLPYLSLLAAAFITFLSSESEEIRERALQELMNCVDVKSFNVEEYTTNHISHKFLSTEKELLQWKLEGLPDEAVAIQNALSIIYCNQCSLIIDPSQRLLDWLLVHYGGSKKVEIISINDSSAFTRIELAARFGKILVLCDIEMIDPIIYTLLNRSLLGHGILLAFFIFRHAYSLHFSETKMQLQFGEKIIDCHDEFKFCSLSETVDESYTAHFCIPSYADSLVTKINFITTQPGLRSQLLALTIKETNSEREAQRRQLLKNQEELKLKLQNMEELILEKLAHLEGTILTNSDLLATLNEAKESSDGINAALKESQNLRLEIDKEREQFMPLVQVACSLYFVICDLHKICNMYRFSLAFFTNLYCNVLKINKSGTLDSLEMKRLISTLLLTTIQSIGLSLRKRDQLIFVLQIIRSVFPNQFDKNEWEFFIGDATEIPEEHPGFEEVPDWIEENCKSRLRELKIMFPELVAKLNLENRIKWKDGFGGDAQKEILPSFVLNSLTPFQQLLVVQALRPDCLHTAMIRFKSCWHMKRLGFKEWRPEPLDLKKFYLTKTSCNEPVLFVTDYGSDPSMEIADLAKCTIGSEQFYQVATGQNQCELALRLLRQCASDGHWLCIKNLHLSVSWLQNLENEFKQLNPKESFRLWLTTEPHQEFSPILLERSLKVAYEAPAGLKQNMLQTWSSLDKSELIQCSLAESRSIFLLSWFHAVCQERRCYIPQGWCKFYEFNYADYKACLHLIKKWFHKKPNDIWEIFQGMFENVVYGGRIENEFDMQILRAYLKQYFNKVIAEDNRVAIAAGQCVLPTSTSYEEYASVISHLPDYDSPDVFGLPSNINRSWEQTESRRNLLKLQKLAHFDTDKTKLHTLSLVAILKPILNLWKRLNQGVNLINARLLLSNLKKNNRTPVETFAVSEYNAAISLVQLVHAELSMLHKSTLYFNSHNLNTQLLSTLLAKNEIPNEWLYRWPTGPKQATEFLSRLITKAKALQQWIQQLNSDTLTNGVVDVSMFFRPETFFNALRQQTASITSYAMQFSWNEISSSSSPCTITGLCIEGAQFDGKYLTDSTANASPILILPPANVLWTKNDKNVQRSESVKIPLYHDSSRSHLISSIDLPCKGDAQKWLVRGVAMFLKN